MIKHVYIHIPFCLKKCKYCSFCSFNLLKKKDEYINSLIKEIEYYYKNEELETLYFGGGTPSLLETDDIKKIISYFKINKNTEITLELNPYQINTEKIQNFKKIGINRISIGAQNFDNKVLKEIGRLHSREDFFKVLYNLKKDDFNNISIDLMYGLPNQTIKDWEETLNLALTLDIQHISLYGLKIEDGTYYKKHMPENLPDNDIQAIMYETAIKKLKEKFIHYEFSNFAKCEKYFSNHNLAYWKKKEYYGFGLSASGYINNKRYTNTFNYQEYIKNPTKKDFETLSKQQNIEEEIFLGLRTYKGIDFKYINDKYNIDIYLKYKKVFDKHIKNGFIEKTINGVKLTIDGILLSNQILCDFIEI